MAHRNIKGSTSLITSLDDLACHVDYSLIDHLNCDPDASTQGDDHWPRQVFSGHYVPVKPTQLTEPEYVAHSPTLFKELGFDDQLCTTEHFIQLFSGDMSALPDPMRKIGWATGYALSIYGTELTQQCPFQTGNGYGDGRAISVVEGMINGKRWEMQLKGAGRTPYCRGGDGRAVLRSSVREFLAQEHMHALGIPTSRSLSLFVSHAEKVARPWYSEGSYDYEPDMLVENPVAITTRVAPSFLRVGQIELFARRARHKAHAKAAQELQMIVLHTIEREYGQTIDSNLPLPEKVVQLAIAYRARLMDLVANWLRVGYCQGNFNSDNCALGGFTLDYGPFGFCERFDPQFQSWTGGGQHFSLFNQPQAAQLNFEMFCQALRPLLVDTPGALDQLEETLNDFPALMQEKMEMMWAAKLGLMRFDTTILSDLISLMLETEVDYTMFFRELSTVPMDILTLKNSFYRATSDALDSKWKQWLERWRAQACANKAPEKVKKQMQAVNPKYTWREWLVRPAYQNALQRDYALIRELQSVLAHPYAEQSKAIEEKYYRLMPDKYLGLGGVAHYSCSS